MSARKRWIATGGVLLLAGGAWFVSAMVLRDEDTCLSTGRTPTQISPSNPHLFACADAVYLPTSNARARFKRVDGLRATEIEVLPFKYLRNADRLYYVALLSVGWEESEYALRVIDGIDLPSMQIVRKNQLRDKSNVYTVLNDHVIVEPIGLPNGVGVTIQHGSDP